MSGTGFFSNKWVKRILWAVVALYAIYLVFGFFVLPRIVKGIAEDDVAEALDREVVLEKVTFNPFSLRMELLGLAVDDDHGDALLKVESIVVDAEIASAFHLQPVLKEFSIRGAKADVQVSADGVLNIERLLALGEGEPKAEETEKGGFGFRLKLFELADVSLSFKDLSKAKPFQELVGPLNLKAEDLIFEPDSSMSPHAFVAKIGDSVIRWEGQAALVPLSSKGRFVVENLQIKKGESYWSELIGLEAEGLVGLDVPYEGEMGESKFEMKSDGLVVSLTDFETGIPGSDDLSFEIPTFEIEASFDTRTRKASVARIDGEGLSVLVSRNEKGALALPGIFVKEETEVVEASADAGPAEGPWAVEGANVSITFTELVFDDRATDERSRLSVTELGIQSKAFRVDDKGGAAELSAKGVVGSTGKFSLQSDIELEPMKVVFETTLETMSLTDFQRYLATYTNADLRSSEVSGFAKGTVDGEGAMDLEFGGTLLSFDLGVAKESGSVSQFESLSVDKGTFDGERVKIGKLTLQKPVFSASLEKNGINALRLFKATEPGEQAATEEATGEIAPAEDPEAIEVEIDEVVVENGRIEFLDKTLEEAFSSLVSNLNFRTTGLSTVKGKSMKLESTASIDSNSTFELEGSLQASDPEEDTDMVFAIKGYDMKATAPYWEKYLGRQIDSGELYVDGEYSVKEKRLKGITNLRIENLALGEAVESPDSLGLPLGLAVALLRDPSGKLEIKNIEITESLDNPEIGVGKLVGQAIGIAIRNVVAKAATAPFSLLGNLVGGGGGGKKNLDTLSFATSEYQLSDEAKEQLDEMAAILEKRPLLKIEIASTTNRDAELAGLLEPLRAFKLRQQLKGENGAAASQEEVDPIAMLASFDKERYQQDLSAAFRENQLYGEGETREAEGAKGEGLANQFASLIGLGPKESSSGNLAVAMVTATAGKEIKKGGSLAELTATFDEMARWLARSHPDWQVDASWLDALASERAKSASAYLVEQKGIASERVIVKEGSGGNAGDSALKLKPVG